MRLHELRRYNPTSGAEAHFLWEETKTPVSWARADPSRPLQNRCSKSLRCGSSLNENKQKAEEASRQPAQMRCRRDVSYKGGAKGLRGAGRP